MGTEESARAFLVGDCDADVLGPAEGPYEVLLLLHAKACVISLDHINGKLSIDDVSRLQKSCQIKNVIRWYSLLMFYRCDNFCESSILYMELSLFDSVSPEREYHQDVCLEKNLFLCPVSLFLFFLLFFIIRLP
jgi:hypothetical protein